MITKLLIATNNQKKLDEINSLFVGTGIEITSLKKEGINLQVEETGSTFKDNAILKAKAYCKASGLATLADDSGIEVDALDGRPGVYSARYASENATDIENYTKLLSEMKYVSNDRRTARYKAVFAIALPDGLVKTCEGTMEGVIALEPKGVNGFGYDPIFYIPELSKTAAEISQEVKNKISHRKIATQKAFEIIKTL